MVKFLMHLLLFFIWITIWNKECQNRTMTLEEWISCITASKGLGLQAKVAAFKKHSTVVSIITSRPNCPGMRKVSIKVQRNSDRWNFLFLLVLVPDLVFLLLLLLRHCVHSLSLLQCLLAPDLVCFMGRQKRGMTEKSQQCHL